MLRCPMRSLYANSWGIGDLKQCWAPYRVLGLGHHYCRSLYLPHLEATFPRAKNPQTLTRTKSKIFRGEDTGHEHLQTFSNPTSLAHVVPLPLLFTHAHRRAHRRSRTGLGAWLFFVLKKYNYSLRVGKNNSCLIRFLVNNINIYVSK